MAEDGTTADAATELRSAADRVEELRADLADEGLDREELDTVADAYRSVQRILDRWEDRATDWDDFEGYVKFRNDLAETLESVPDDVPGRDAFLEADSCVKTGGVSKSLRSSDFDDARGALEPVRNYADLQSDLDSAIDARREARKRARKRRRELRDRIETLEELLELGDADLDAPIDRLREPITVYDERIDEAFRTFRREASARAFLEFIDRAAGTPFVDYRQPPAELMEYVRKQSAGEYPIDELLDYAEYSPSKLSHYVDDADLLKRRVGTNRTYLERLSAEQLSIGWPPESAERLRFRIEEMLPLVGQIAEEPAVSTLREIRTLTRESEYERIRGAARADAKLTDDQRRRLERGEVSDELSAAREELQRLRDTLSEHTDTS